jgi:hypothetical protein
MTCHGRPVLSASRVLTWGYPGRKLDSEKTEGRTLTRRRLLNFPNSRRNRGNRGEESLRELLDGGPMTLTAGLSDGPR